MNYFVDFIASWIFLLFCQKQWHQIQLLQESKLTSSYVLCISFSLRSKFSKFQTILLELALFTQLRKHKKYVRYFIKRAYKSPGQA